MKKLSELSDDTMLTVEHKSWYGGKVMDKMDLIQQLEGIRNDGYLDELVVRIAEATYATFSFDDVIEWAADEMHEDWIDNVTADLEGSHLDIRWIEDQINDIYKRNPSYHAGDLVEVNVI